MIYKSTLNDYENIYSSCIVYIVVLFVIFFIINIAISSGAFIYFHWYWKIY